MYICGVFFSVSCPLRPSPSLAALFALFDRRGSARLHFDEMMEVFCFIYRGKEENEGSRRRRPGRGGVGGGGGPEERAGGVVIRRREGRNREQSVVDCLGKAVGFSFLHEGGRPSFCLALPVRYTSLARTDMPFWAERSFPPS